MKKLLCLVLAAVMLFALFAGCKPTVKDEGDPKVEVTPTPEVNNAPVFAFIIPGLDANWYVEIVDSFKYAAEEVGAEVLILSSDYDVEKEVANIDLCVTEGVDGLCMFSFNENGAALAAKKMEAAGIPIIVPDSVGQALNKGAD